MQRVARPTGAKLLRADFLIGVSQREIDEALGYRFTEGLESRRVTARGGRARSRSTARDRRRGSSDRADRTRRICDGRRMVVGRVVCRS